MKRLIFSACLVAASFGAISCEKHDWDETKKLYQEHGEGHGDDHGHKKSEDHGSHEGHDHGAEGSH